MSDREARREIETLHAERERVMRELARCHGAQAEEFLLRQVEVIDIRLAELGDRS